MGSAWIQQAFKPVFMSFWRFSWYFCKTTLYAGATFDEQVDASEGSRDPSVRHSTQTRIMLHALVCGEDPNCPYTAYNFFRALRQYGCNCYSKKRTSIIKETKTWWHMEHHGAPIDAVDQACLDVANAYRKTWNWTKSWTEQNQNFNSKFNFFSFINACLRTNKMET